MEANCGVEVITLETQSIACAGILDQSGRKEELFDPEHVGSIYALLKVGSVTPLTAVDALVAAVCHVGCDVENGELLPVLRIEFRFHFSYGSLVRLLNDIKC